MPELKAVTGIEVKDADQGLASVVFSTFNTVDSDGDITLPGAFEDGARVRVSAYGHASWGPSRGASFVPVPPVGKGVIRAGADEAVADLEFFMRTTGGRETFELVKEMGDLQEWSYGYDVIESDKGKHDGKAVRFLKRLKTHEVSPVLLGAGVDTRTLTVKSGEPLRILDSSSPYFIGETSSTATGLVVDYGAAGQKERPPFPDEAERVLGDIALLVARIKGWGSDSDTKEGRVLSSANRDRLSGLVSALSEARAALDELLSASDPEKHRKELLRQVARYERLRAGV